MITFIQGDLLRDDAEALVNTVNCVGVMGRGVALQFKNAFPANYEAYVEACENDAVQPGRMFVFATGYVTHPRYIINFPTKRHWRGKSRMEDIESGLDALAAEIQARGIRSLAMPPLGSGLGGLDWMDVKAIVLRRLSGFEGVDIRIYEPQGAPAARQMVRNREVPRMTAGRAALVELIRRYLGGLLDPMITLLEVHKLMYLLQEVGEPLRLRYTKGPYGPYAENLGHVLKAVEGHLISGYADGGDAPDKRLQLVPGAAEEAARFLSDQLETRHRFDAVSRLVDGFETPFGLELLTTVHWIQKHDRIRDLSDLVSGVHSWNDRKRRFTARQIDLARDALRRSPLGVEE